MTTDPRLLVPLADLPGPVPSGAPVAYDRASGWLRAVAVGHTPDGVLLAVDAHALHPWSVVGLPTASDIYLDLSPPPIVDGCPVRVDGADVLAKMVARAHRWPGAVAAAMEFVPSTEAPGYRIRLRVLTGDGRAPAVYLDSSQCIAIDPDDPLADRLALAAVARHLAQERER